MLERREDDFTKKIESCLGNNSKATIERFEIEDYRQG